MSVSMSRVRRPRRVARLGPAVLAVSKALPFPCASTAVLRPFRPCLSLRSVHSIKLSEAVPFISVCPQYQAV